MLKVFELVDLVRTRLDHDYATPHTVTVEGLGPDPIVVPVVMEM